MAQSSGQKTTSKPAPSPSGDFGANEWLVDEMYQQYKEDPKSVSPEWAKYFKTNGSGGEAESGDKAPESKQGEAKQAEPRQDKPKQATPKQAKPKQDESKKSGDKPKSEDKKSASSSPAPQAKPRPETPAAEPAKGERRPVAKDPKPPAPAEAKDEPTYTILRGAPARTVQNMDASLSIPVATSVRTVPVKLLWDNRTVINNHLARARGGKVSFTHIIGYALIKALKSMPEMNVGYDVIDGKPTLVSPAHINLGLAIDIAKKDGTRALLVPSIKAAETMDFAAFWTGYEDIVRKARNGKLAIEDFQGTTISLTNPGTLGTNHSVPRLMKGQGAIIGVGAMEYPSGWQGASEEAIARNAIGKVMTLTST